MAYYPFRSALLSGFVLLMNVRKCSLELLYDEQSMLKNAAFFFFFFPSSFFLVSLVPDGRLPALRMNRQHNMTSSSEIFLPSLPPLRLQWCRVNNLAAISHSANIAGELCEDDFY